MPLPIPMLDDRRFQDIVDQAKRMIPQYCPEWTDHNVSDPGVTMIELFAWMTDLLLYRVNQVPQKMYFHFLELLGVSLEPPRSAQAPVTFYLSAAQEFELTIPRETEVSTLRTEVTEPVIFTTEQDLVIRPAALSGAYSRSASRGGSGWAPYDLRQLSVPGRTIPVFPASLAVGDAFYLSFNTDLSSHVLALVIDCSVAGGAGIDPTRPPFEWQVWQGGLARWVNCEVEFDGTGGFNHAGEIILHLPPMARDELQGVSGFWLRCRLTEAQAAAEGSYRETPQLTALRAESRGGTVNARHAVTVINEFLGQSDGTPGQTFRLAKGPLLSRDPERDYLIVRLSDGSEEHWQEVPDFGTSHGDDRHYTIDTDGTIRLGPSLLQPDGSVYRFGVVPPKGADLHFSRYQYGGGTSGNIARGMLATLKTSIPYVAQVINRSAAAGGQNGQMVEDAIIRAPNLLRLRTRAVTADDYEYLTVQVPNVARAYCLAPAAQPGTPDEPRPGNVTIVVLPQVSQPEGEILPEQLSLSAELRGAVANYLGERSLVTTRLEVRAPQYIFVSVQARLRLPARTNPVLASEVQRKAEAALYHYLNPFVGGPEGKGWPFGRDLHVSEVYGLLQRLGMVEFVEEVQINVREPGRSASIQPVLSRLEVPPVAVICSYQHRVTISQ